MITQSYIKYLLVDEASLHRYYIDKEYVGVDDIKRSLMLEERRNNIYIPDHHYRLGQEKTFEGISLLSDIFTQGLYQLSLTYLEFRKNKIYVKASKQTEWQLLLPYIPPSLLISIRLYYEFPAGLEFPKQYISQYIIPNIRYTSLPSPYIPQMEDMRRNNPGFYDLHIHLNGTLETDITWQDILRHPKEVYQELKLSANNEKVQEHFTQLSPFLSPFNFYKLIKIARTLRHIIQSIITGVQIHQLPVYSNFLSAVESFSEKIESVDNLFFDSDNISFDSRYHEVYFYIRVFDYLTDKPDDNFVASLFHYYLLILGQANKLLVQQSASFGFEEFQKHTLNGLREYSERYFNRRFFQLAGNCLDNIRLLEGRFSPKDTLSKNLCLIDRIISAWKKLTVQQREQGLNNASKLKLTAHFIKKKDTQSHPFIRHYKLRKDIEHRVKILRELKNGGTHHSKYIIGIDAAASEFDTPPEVFAPAYKSLRKSGYNHFTFHAGEDFFHILSGLRAIFEAIEFLGLQPGDRIGHASASGIDVNLWAANLGPRLLIRKGEYLDDLIFAYNLIYNNRKSVPQKLSSLLPQLSIRISELSAKVYDTTYAVEQLRAAWLKRGEDPIPLLYKENTSGIIQDILLKYHSCKEKYDSIDEIDTFDVFDAEDLTSIQLLLLEYMHDKDIVIETLPTSNVTIGVHHSYSSYHIYNWYKWSQEGKPIPPIIVGTDDAGIFATNIYNEYCNIFCFLKNEKQMNINDIISFLKQLHYNSTIYGFDSNT